MSFFKTDLLAFNIYMDTSPTLGYNSPFISKMIYLFWVIKIHIYYRKFGKYRKTFYEEV